MKKLLLAAGLAVSISGICAPPTDILAPGFHPNETVPYAYEDFNRVIASKPSEYDNLYLWTQKKDSTIVIDSTGEDGCVQLPRTFKYSWDRTSEPGYGIVTIHTVYGAYEPVGLSFGDKSLDLSDGGNKTEGKNCFVGYSVTNLSSNALQLRIGLQDINKKIVTAHGRTIDTEMYTDEVNIKLLTKGASARGLEDYNHFAYEAVYTRPSCGIADNALNRKDSTSFDYTKVSSVTFTVVSNENSDKADGYKPFGLGYGEFSEPAILKFDYIYVGGENLVLALVEEAEANRKVAFTVSPNPASKGSVKLSSLAENVRVSDLLGNVVFSANSASEINVENFTKGIYVVQSSKGTTRLVVE